MSGIYWSLMAMDLMGDMKLMNKKEITQLLITHNGVYAGVLHMHQLIQEGISV